MKKQSLQRFAENLVIVLVGVVLYWGLTKYKTVEHWLAVFAEILAPFVIGTVIALVLNVPMSFIERTLFHKKNGDPRSPFLDKIARPLSLTMTLLGCAGLVAAVLALVIPSVKNTAVQLYEQIPDFVNRIFAYARSDPDLYFKLKDMGLSADKVITSITEKVSDANFIQTILSGVISTASGAMSKLVNFIIGLVFAIYLLAKKELLKDQAYRITTAYLPEKAAKKLAHVGNLSKETFSKFISGQGLEACILGSLCALGMWLLKLPYAGTIGMLVAVTAFIPIVGAFIGLAVGAVLILITSFKQAVIFVVFLLVLQQIENNLIYPRVVGSSVGLPSMWVLFAITVGGSVGGIFGMFVAVPVCSIFYCLLGDSVNRRNRRKAEKKAAETIAAEDMSNAPDWLGAVTEEET